MADNENKNNLFNQSNDNSIFGQTDFFGNEGMKKGSLSLFNKNKEKKEDQQETKENKNENKDKILLKEIIIETKGEIKESNEISFILLD